MATHPDIAESERHQPNGKERPQTTSADVQAEGELESLQEKTALHQYPTLRQISEEISDLRHRVNALFETEVRARPMRTIGTIAGLAGLIGMAIGRRRSV